MRMLYVFFFFFFSSRRRHTRCLSDWSSDVCSSDLTVWMVCHLGEDRPPLDDDATKPLRFEPRCESRTRVGTVAVLLDRSEERRVGKECRSRWWADHYKKKREV